jgi:phosphoglucomutase
LGRRTIDNTLLDSDRVTADLKRHLEARPSGTEDVYKLCAESFKGSDHLRRIQEEAQAIIQRVFSEGGTGAA